MRSDTRVTTRRRKQKRRRDREGRVKDEWEIRNRQNREDRVHGGRIEWIAKTEGNKQAWVDKRRAISAEPKKRLRVCGEGRNATKVLWLMIVKAESDHKEKIIQSPEASSEFVVAASHALTYKWSLLEFQIRGEGSVLCSMKVISAFVSVMQSVQNFNWFVRLFRNWSSSTQRWEAVDRTSF